MVKIALAGATSGIGLAIRQELDAQHTHEYVILVRRPIENDEKAILVDYTSVEMLEKALRAASIHTVISCLSIADEASGLAQLKLIEASNKASSVERILPSEFGADYKEVHMRLMPSYIAKLQARQLLSRLNLEYSIVSIGMFLDYWSTPYIHSALDPTPGAAMFIDLAHKFAAIPGDGNVPMVFTHSQAAAKFILAMMNLPSWPKDCSFAGDRLTLAEFLSRAQEAGGVKFETHYDKLEDVEAGNVTVTPDLTKLMPEEYCKPFAKNLHDTYLTGAFDLPTDKCRNEILAQKPYVGFQDMIEAWKAAI